MLTKERKKELEKFALQIRIGAMEAFKARGFGHIGGSMSIVDALAVLYGEVMKVDSKNPKMEDRDKLVCSKGHAGPAVYAALALKGFFPYEDIKTLNQPGTNFPSHCDRNKTPGIDVTTGSLGQGTSQAIGLALGDKIKGLDSRTFLIVGDGESNEGQVWEAAMFAAAKKVTNLVWLVDWNKKQLDGYVSDIMDIGNLQAKFEAFGFESICVEGSNLEQLYEALTKPAEEKPIAVILDTVKGKGVEEIENMFSNHSITTTEENYDRWLTELKRELEELG